MSFSENVLKISLVIALAILVMYAMNCLVNERIRPLKEGFEDEYCESAFTSPGTLVCLWSVGAMRYLNVDISRVTNNLKLSALSDTCAQWKMERVIVRESVGVYPQATTPQSCAVTIKTSKMIEGAMTSTQKAKLAKMNAGIGKDLSELNDEMNNIESLGFSLVADPAGDKGSVAASPVGGASNGVWYAIRLNQGGGNGPKKKVLAKLYTDTVNHLMKNGRKSDGKFYLIMTSPKDMISADAPLPASEYLTVADDFDSVTNGDIHLTSYPTVSSVWQVKYKTKGQPLKMKPFKPIAGIGAYPNQDPEKRGLEGPYKTTYGAFMPSFVRIWNRTWWSPGASSTSGKDLFQITVDLDAIPENRQKTYTTGTVAVSLVAAEGLDYDNPSKNPAIPSPVLEMFFPPGQKKVSFPVQTYGDDMLMGTIPSFKGKGSEIDTRIIIQILPKGAREMGTPNVPLIKGWLISTVRVKGSGTTEEKDTTAGILPLCAVSRSGIIQNLMGVCQALTGDMKFDQFMLENGITSINFSKNFNMSNRIATASNFNPPPKDWVRYLTPGNLQTWSYGDPGTSPLGGANLQRTATVKNVGSINECASYAEGNALLPSNSANVTFGTNPATGAPLNAQDVAESTNRFLYHVPPGYTVNAEGNNTGASNGVCELGMYGDWELLPKSQMDSAIGVVRRGPRTGLYGSMETKFREIGGVGTGLEGGTNLNVVEQFENHVGERKSRKNKKSGSTKEDFVVGNIQFCAELCKNDKACLEYQYDPTSGDCQLKTYGKPTVTDESRRDEVVSYEFVGPRNQLVRNKQNFTELPTFASFLGEPRQLIDASGNVTTNGIPNVNTIDDCADMCMKGADNNCDRFSWDAQNQVCYLQTMGQEEYKQGSTVYGAIKNNFKPYINPSYDEGSNAVFNKMNTGMDFQGESTPNAPMESNVATVNDCARACAANPWCGTMTYDATKKICTQNLSTDNLQANSFQTGDPRQVLLQKKPPADVLLNSQNATVFNPPQPSSYIDGGVSLTNNIVVSDINECAEHCLNNSNNLCDAFVYERSDTKSDRRCNTYQSGDCQNNPNSAICGKVTSPADSPNSYATKMKLSEEKGGLFKEVVGNNGTCRGQLYCQKNWNNELSDTGWSNAECANATATYENGETIEVNCLDLPPFSYKGSNLKHFRVKCAKTSGEFAFKESSGPLAGIDCNVDTNARILLGRGSGTIDKGTCDCQSYTEKALFGGKELESKGAGSWKGARAAYAKTYDPSATVVSPDFSANQVPTNRATSISGNGPSLACYVTADNNNPFIPANSANGKTCAGGTTDYQCTIL